MLDRLQRNLELSEHNARFAYCVKILVHVTRGDEGIRSRSHDDRVIAVRSYGDHRNSRWTARSAHPGRIDAASLELSSQLLCKRIGTYAADHANRMAKSRYSHGLIRTLTARMHLEVATVDGLPRQWNPLGTRDEVDVDAPDYNNRFTIHIRVTIEERRRAPPSSR